MRYHVKAGIPEDESTHQTVVVAAPPDDERTAALKAGAKLSNLLNRYEIPARYEVLHIACEPGYGT